MSQYLYMVSLSLLKGVLRFLKIFLVAVRNGLPYQDLFFGISDWPSFTREV